MAYVKAPNTSTMRCNRQECQLTDADIACELVEGLAADPLEEGTIALAWDWHRPTRPAVGRLNARRSGVRRQKIASDLVGRVGIEPTTQGL